MRAERRRRARAAARRPRWTAPPRRLSARASGRTVSTIDAAVMVVRSYRALRAMEADLRSADRGLPVVGLACLQEINAPVLAPQLVRKIVGIDVRIYYVPREYLLRRLHGMLGPRLALPAGGARVWWPGLAPSSDPAAHPLVLALDSESETDMLAEFARRFDVSRPYVGAEIRLIEDARALAERELSQALEQNRGLVVDRDRALTRAQPAERALQAATQRRRELDGGRRS
jgi:hypothetical protein